VKISPKAAKQMYPHLVSVECEEHGTQTNGRVPEHFSKVFENRPIKGWACSVCIDEAREAYNKHQSDLRRMKEKEKKSQRETVLESREGARELDKNLPDYIEKCDEAEGRLNTMKTVLEAVRGDIRKVREGLGEAKKRLDAASVDYERLNDRFSILMDEAETTADSLESAVGVSDSCYNDLREKLQEADSRWLVLGKGAKRKRNKTNRRLAISRLKKDGRGDDDEQV